MILRNLLGFANINLRLINDDEPSYQIQEFASEVFKAFRRSQIEKKTDAEKKELFFTDFDKILNSTNLKTNKNLKDEIYDDLISDATSHLRRINTTKQENYGRRRRISGVRVVTARNFKDNGEEDSIQIRLLIYNLRHRSEQQIEGSPSSFRLGWSELLPILSPEITSYLRLGLSHILTPSMQVFSKLSKPLAAESGLQPEASYASSPIKPPIQKQASEPSMNESEPPPQTIPAEDAKRDKVAEFEKFLKKIDPDFQITKNKYDEILSQYYKYKECEEEFKTRKTNPPNLHLIYKLTESEEEFKTRKTNTPNLHLIYKLTESEKNLKNTISSCLQLSSDEVTIPLPSVPNNSKKAKKNSNRTTSTTYQIKDNEFYEVLKYLEYEQIKAHYEQNPPPKNNYGPPKPNDILDDLVKSIGETPSNILRALDRFHTNSKNGQGPPQ